MSERSPTVSVIIPTHNRAHLVGRAIRSVLNQTYQDFEIIVVDDGSIDTTEKVVRRFDDDRIRYIRHGENKGGSAARNTGIKAAKGKYIAFLDSDDEWLPEKLEKQTRAFENEDLQVGVVYAKFVNINENGESLDKNVAKCEGFAFRQLLSSNRVGTVSSVMVRSECFQKVGGFDETLPSCQDWDMWLRLARHYKFHFIPEVLVKYFKQHEPRIGTNPEAVIAGRKAIFRKFQTDIENQGRGVKAKHYFRLGSYLCHFGRMKEGRQNLLQALLMCPWSPKYFIYFFASILGKRTYLKLAQIKGILDTITMGKISQKLYLRCKKEA